jgi:phosphocarrier protein HPr
MDANCRVLEASLSGAAFSIWHADRMNSQPVIRVIVIQNEQGLHARPAELFARTARQFQSRIEVVREGRRVEARNIIDLLTLGALPGTELVLEAVGDDAESAVETLVRLVENGFAEEAPQQQKQ